jgi:L-aminopeptidase/D-esterase-like protein
VVRDAVVAWQYKNRLFDPLGKTADVFWALPVVAETYDGVLNDINGFHVKKEHALEALEKAKPGGVEEGGVGGGTGMICHGFKGGIGTASRVVKIGDSTFTVGVLVQANYGVRNALTIAGVPVGAEIQDLKPKVTFGEPADGNGSIIVVVATNAPLLPHQLDRLARRVPIGLGKVGGHGENSSGDIFIAFSTANRGAANQEKPQTLTMLPNDLITPLFYGTAQAVEEAILNALVAAQTMVGMNGNTVYELPHDRVVELLKKYNRYTKKR